MQIVVLIVYGLIDASYIFHEFVLWHWIYAPLRPLGCNITFFGIQFFLFIYTCISYLAAALTDPGILTDERLAEIKNKKGYKQELDEFGELCFCYKCKKERPLRCHHNTGCDKCILVYEHYCPFIQNQVGSRNFKIFILFMLVIILWSLSVIPIYVQAFNIIGINETFIFSLIFSLIIIISFGYFAIPMFYEQITLAMKNMTSIEKLIFEKVKRKHQNYQHRFDLGSFYKNLQCRLGENPWLWLIPVPNTKITGIFEQNPNYISSVELDMQDDANDINSSPHDRLSAYIRSIKQDNDEK
ncbi:DHHC zinc finger domain containing protein [Trichomonas vaginalis G3]|uniref:Palmitoyltransferase n=1 Tax=Trichomonas vaginalis (strain ATCC PRA-98 / G3) TaxID=412133 RepID=A2DII0_TRIV3|nr:cysteine S-palmitoyltransferase protein [Trichomonas vaginalis G3]EAY19784.1 DHHC zinc finger domain containing protein [Trichomonas vaginalis G3]KAI5523988.1 cysteine S-palmitoyltransferase protein [Trichomonas vaginalis G3]|eukprot:XP_001580770.1 DHHC zinc finger domain containing protein [Trichomonas vaginalis G3]